MENIDELIRRMNFSRQYEVAEALETLRRQLAERDLQIKTLREALENIKWHRKPGGVPTKFEYEVEVIADKALSTPQDLSALHAYGKRIADAVEKLTVERCAKEAKALGNGLDNEWNRNLGVANDLAETANECAINILALPLGQIDIEDLGK